MAPGTRAHPPRPCDRREGISTTAIMPLLEEQHLPKSASAHVKETGCPLRIRRRSGTTARLKCCRTSPEQEPLQSPSEPASPHPHQDYSPSAVTTDSSDQIEPHHQPSCAVNRVIFPNSAFLDQDHERSNTKVPRNSSVLAAILKALLMVLLVILFVNLPSADACSSRSTPKPRPPSHSAIRPNITFQTYACPPAYAAWYCLNGATCFTVKIADSILYNCECADGYMGQRCEFKDLDGTYLPARERLSMLWNPGSSLMHGSGAGGDTSATLGGQSRVGNAFLGVLLIIVATVVGAAVYTKSRSKAKRASSLHLVATLPPSPAALPAVATAQQASSYVDQVSEKLQRSLRRLFSRKTAPAAPDVEQRTPSCQCHDGSSAPYMLSFHTAFQQQQLSAATPAAQGSTATGEAVFQISSRLPYNVCNVALPHETGSAPLSGPANQQEAAAPSVDKYPNELNTTTTVNSSPQMRPGQ